MNNNESQPQRKKYQPTEIGLWIVMGMAVLLLTAFAVFTAAIQVNNILEANQEEDSPDSPTPEAALDRANEAVDLANTLLSFLEGASVLVALALGAAAIFGFQNSRELRRDIEEERRKIESELQKFSQLREKIEPVEKDLKQLPVYLDTMKHMQSDFLDLLQASQELSLKNYTEAYNYAVRVLEHSPENTQALYIAGWLETQYIPDKLDAACKHLEKAIRLDADAMSVKAAYGVALRRMAANEKLQQEKERLWTESLGFLLQALGSNPNLIDLNRESFWGPVGGNYRDLGDTKAAIKAYERALAVTPGSSYPVGNLGMLYLQQAKEDQSEAMREKALDTFDSTVRFSESERGNNPNDYFVLMDLAMAYTMLGARHGKNFHEAQTWLTAALRKDINATYEMLRVSAGGWRRLREACPDDWKEVQIHLDKGIQEIQQVMDERQAAQT